MKTTTFKSQKSIETKISISTKSQKSITTEIFDPTKLQKLLKADAKALGIPAGSAEIFISRTITGVKQALRNKKLITKDDLDRAVYKELKKYHPDFAYVYKNRGKIV